MEDVIPFMFGGAILGLCAGLGFSKYKPRPTDYSKLLKFEPLYFAEDPDCAIMFIKLQHYRHYAVEAFDAAGDAADSIFCLIRRFNEREIKWTQKYNRNATENFIQMERALDTFEADARHWLYDVPVGHINELDQQVENADTNPETKENYAILTERMNSGLSSFMELAQIKEAIVARLKAHILRLE